MPDEGEIAGRIEAQWQALLACRRGAAPVPPAAGVLAELYGPICAIPAGRAFAVAHLAQSLDGRIATSAGVSRWISGEADLHHTHCMRALADAVVVGAETIRNDDPLLTVRRCAGKHPVRVVIDPDRKLGPRHRVFTDASTPTIVIAAEDSPKRGAPGFAEVLRLPRTEGVIAPAAIRAALAARGLHWLFIEGGGVTISHFLRAGSLDRLQLTVAPMILGSGRPSVTLPEITAPTLGLRPQIRRIALGEDVLFECIFGAADGA